MRKNRMSENDKKDIVRAVTSAKDPIIQCEIEAQLRCMHVCEVEDILREYGVCVRRVPKNSGGRKPRVSDEALKKMVREGYSVEQIAQMTQYGTDNVYARLAAIKRKEYIAEAKEVMA